MSIVTNSKDEDKDYIHFETRQTAPAGVSAGTIWYEDPQEYTSESGLMIRTGDSFDKAIPSFYFGTFTPTMGDGTNNFNLTTAVGQYHRIGNLVYAVYRMVWNSKGSASGNIRISLPFTCATQTNRRNYLAVGYSTYITIGSSYQIAGRASSGLNYISLIGSLAGNTGLTLNDGHFGASGELDLHGWFMAASSD